MLALVTACLARLDDFNPECAVVKKPYVNCLAIESSFLQMSIIFNEAGVKDITLPCVAQTFINHNALLYKVFVIGDQHYTIERPSIRNLYPGGKTKLG